MSTNGGKGGNGKKKSAAQIATRRVHSGKVVDLDVDRVRFPDGSEGELEIFRHSGASAVVPFLSDPTGEDPQILLLRQYRYAADGYLLEVPAGRLEPDEDPADCARRELREETGCECEELEHLTTIYTTPGFTDEKIHLYMALGITHGESALEDDEFAEPVTLSLSDALAKIADGEICDSKTVIAILYAAGFLSGQ